MERLRHPNIVEFHEALDTLLGIWIWQTFFAQSLATRAGPRPKQIYLIMDFVSGGSLHHFLKKRPNRRTDDPLAKRLFFQAGNG